MFLSILGGFVISKFIRKWNFSLILAILLGSLIGYLGALGVYGVVYPFYIARVMDVLWIDEVVLYSVFFIVPQIKIFLFEGAWLSSEMPLNPVVVVLLVISSIVSVLIGQVAGRKWLWRIRILDE
jgi:hypothetical protein